MDTGKACPGLAACPIQSRRARAARHWESTGITLWAPLAVWLALHLLLQRTEAAGGRPEKHDWYQLSVGTFCGHEEEGGANSAQFKFPGQRDRPRASTAQE